MDREGRVGHDRGITGPQHGQAGVAEAFLAADAGDDLAVGVEAGPEFAFVLGGHLLAEVVDALAGGIALVARVAGGLDQLVDDHLRRGVQRIAHAQIDDVDARLPFFQF